MALNFNVLPLVLYKPKEAFQKIGKVTFQDGIMMLVILAIVGNIFGLIFGFAGQTATAQFDVGAWAIGLVVGIVIGVISLFVLSFVVSKIAGALGGKEDFEQTLGLFAYSGILGVVQQLIVGALAFLMVGISLRIIQETQVKAASLGQLGAAALNLIPNLMSFLMIMMVFTLIFFIWGLWVYGTAVAQANGTTLGKGILAYFIGVVIVALIISLVVGAAMVGTGISYSSMFAGF